MFGSTPLEGLPGPAFGIERGLDAAVVRAGGGLGDDRDGLAWGALGWGSVVCESEAGGGSVEAAPHVLVSSDKFGGGSWFFGVELKAVHVGFLAF